MATTVQKPPTSEWLKVMVEEVERKRDETARARREQQLRAAERSEAPGGAATDGRGTGASTGRVRSGRRSR